MAPFAHSPFRWLVGGRFVSMLGTAIAPIALAFAVLDLTGSATDLGLVLAARSIPLVVFVLVGGVVADRLPRHHVLLASNLVSAACQAAAATLLLTGNATIGALVCIEIVAGASAAFLWPALAGLTPQTVPGPVLQQANALLRLANNAALIGGSAVAGLLVAAVGPGWGLAADAVTYALGALCLSRIRLPATDRLAAGNAFAELKEGWSEFRSRQWVWVIVLAAGFSNMAYSGGMSTLGPVVADETIGRGGWGLVLASLTAGMVLGGLVALRLRPERSLLVAELVALLLGPLLFALAVHPTLPVLVPAAVLAGAGLEVFGVYWDLSLQQHIPSDRLSRVASYDAFGSFVFMPVGQVIAGPLAAVIGLEEAIASAAVLAVVANGLTLLSTEVRQLRRTDVAEPVAGRV
jgi:MFS family permease